MSRSAGTSHEPVLVIPGRGELQPDLPVGIVCAIVAGVETVHRAPNGLRRIAEVWLGLDPDYERLAAAAARPLPPYAVRTIDDPRWSHELALGDVLAHRGEDRIRAVMAALRAEPGVIEVAREDREVVLLRAKGVSLERIVEIAAGVLGPGEAREAPDAPHGPSGASVP